MNTKAFKKPNPKGDEDQVPCSPILVEDSSKESGCSKAFNPQHLEVHDFLDYFDQVNITLISIKHNDNYTISISKGLEVFRFATILWLFGLLLLSFGFSQYVYGFF